MVLEQKDNLPVYKVQNIKKPKDVRVVHRNKIMGCAELPMDIFDDQKSDPVKKVKAKSTKKPSVQKAVSVVEPTVDQESDEEEQVVIVEELPAPRAQELEVPVDDLDVTVPYDDSTALEVAEESEEVESEEQAESEADESMEDPSSPVILRRSTRNHVPAKRLTYDTIGGNPVITSVGDDGVT